MTCKAVEELWARCVLTLLGLAGISGQFHFKGELMCGRKRKKKLPFLTNLHSPPSPPLHPQIFLFMQSKGEKGGGGGHVGAYDIMSDCFWSAPFEEKNVYSPQLPNYAARRSEHVPWSTNKTNCVYLQACWSSQATDSIQ